MASAIFERLLNQWSNRAPNAVSSRGNSHVKAAVANGVRTAFMSYAQGSIQRQGNKQYEKRVTSRRQS